MATTTQKLTFEEFEAEYRQSDRTYEFWYGEAIPKGMPTWVHGLLQKIVMQLLEEAGFTAASEVELRIEPGARPKPDVIGTKTKPQGRYPITGLEVVVEIVSEDDKISAMREHCHKYQAWGFGQIYLIDPRDRSVVEWKDGSMMACPEFVGLPVERIWNALDAQHFE